MRVLLGLVEGPLVPGITLLLSSFYTRKELAFRYVAGLLFSSRISCRPSHHWLSRIALFTSTASVRCEVLSPVFLPSHVTVHPAVRCFFRVTLCRNREHEWRWWKTRMGLDLYYCTFWNIYGFVAVFNHSHRKDCSRFSSALPVSSLCLLRHAIPIF